MNPHCPHPKAEGSLPFLCFIAEEGDMWDTNMRDCLVNPAPRIFSRIFPENL